MKFDLTTMKLQNISIKYNLYECILNNLGDKC